MFGKLLKYEFKNTGKVLLPAFGLGIGGALILNLFHWILSRFSMRIGEITNELFRSLVGLYALCVIVFSVGYAVVRFYRTMVGSEAYLTLTLPVNSTLHIWAKYLSGLCYSLLAVLASIVTSWAYDFRTISFGIWEFSGENGNLQRLTGSQWLSVNGFLLCSAIVFAAFILMEFFFCCAVGSQFKNKVVASVVTYFIAHNAVGVITIMLLIPVAVGFDDQLISWLENTESWFGQLMQGDAGSILNGVMGYLWVGLLIAAAYMAIWFIGYFLASRYFLTKKVNLD